MYLLIWYFIQNLTQYFSTFSGDEGVGGGGGGGGKQRHNSSDKNIREYFSKHPSSSPVRHTGAKSPSPQGANYPMVRNINGWTNFFMLVLVHLKF